MNPQRTGGGVKSLQRRYTALTHTYGAMLVANYGQRGLNRNSYALGDTYLLIGVKMTFPFFRCENILGFTVYCAVTHTWDLSFCETRLLTVAVRVDLLWKKLLCARCLAIPDVRGDTHP